MLVALGIVSCFVGCASPPEDVPWVVSRSLLGQAPRRYDRPPARCPVAGETRFARGCLGQIRLTEIPGEVAGAGRRRFRLPAALRGTTLLVRGRWNGGAGWQEVPSWVLSSAAGPIEVGLPAAIDHGVETELWVSLLGPRDQLVTSRSVTLPARVTIAGGFAIHDWMRGLAAPTRFSVEMEIAAQGEWGEFRVPVWESVLDPGEDPSDWYDFRVDLSPYAGAKVKFRFATVVQGEGEVAVSAPVWSEPLLLVEGEERLRVLTVLADADAGAALPEGSEVRSVSWSEVEEGGDPLGLGRLASRLREEGWQTAAFLPPSAPGGRSLDAYRRVARAAPVAERLRRTRDWLAAHRRDAVVGLVDLRGGGTNGAGALGELLSGLRDGGWMASSIVAIVPPRDVGTVWILSPGSAVSEAGNALRGAELGAALLARTAIGETRLDPGTAAADSGGP